MMQHKEIAEKICTIIAKAFPEVPKEQLTGNLDRPFAEYVQMQSIHAMAITSSLEDELDCELDAEDFMQCASMSEVVRYVETVVVPETSPAADTGAEAAEDDAELGFCEDDELLYKMFPNIR